MKNETTAERTSDRELTVTRTFNAPAHLVFEAWSKPELFQRWWIPKSFGLTLVSCKMDVRTGGTYRLEIRPPGAEHAMAFFGTYRDVVLNKRISWTNEESAEGAITTATFEEKDGKTFVVVRDLYPTKEALDAAIASGSTGGFPEQFDTLDTFLANGWGN